MMPAAPTNAPDTYIPIPPVAWRASHYRTLLLAFEAVARGGLIHAPRTCGAYHETKIETGLVVSHHLRERLWDLSAAGLLSVTGHYPEFQVVLTPLGLWVAQAIGLRKQLDDVRWDALRTEAPVALLPEYAGLNACYVEEDLLSSAMWVILPAGKGPDGRVCFGILRGFEIASYSVDGKVARYASVQEAKTALQGQFSSTGSLSR